MNEEIINRKGARKAQDIPNEVLELLNEGKIETVNLTEWLAVDHLKLINTSFSEIGISQENIKSISDKIKTQKKPSTMNTTRLVGSALYDFYSSSKEINSIFDKLSSHISDSIRCYAPYLKSLDEKLNIDEKLNQSKKLIADTHFGVLEVVWMALRPEIDNNLEKSIEILSDWTKNKDENIRRFTTESTRPRGVWCKHIEQLKENPEIALPVLENLKSDKSNYVQNSVGNWLNDASKTTPNFVIELCKKWKIDSPTKETEKIIKRARRTIDKK
ncbi:DNA alkylation repair protein [Hyunsoonleella pacifica]|uniref:DNA alkylation repair protein n=1 Tax=Hyunsoonleella pacifica TaxID=1080224 RepID=A0A4Q9FQ49_9FLAO|nr:DNA alkylation repair protein [Hyunsoonleella pacifica]TBN17561.1 DNA alkylation repair protein [Hyunsoonleella pacifica]GGD10883.1 DNA alkylation repair protein [Hyunsoonleella pacifica]